MKMLKSIIDRLNLKREDLIPFFVFIGIIVVIFIIGLVFNLNLIQLGPIVLVISLSILCLITWAMAGVVIFRSLFLLSGELSLMIFLAQAYCGPDVSRTLTSTESLKILFGFGILYMLGIFVVTLYKGIMGDKEKSKGSLKTLEEINGGKKPVLILCFYAIFIAMFLLQLYQVIYPIADSLCIYK